MKNTDMATTCQIKIHQPKSLRSESKKEKKMYKIKEQHLSTSKLDQNQRLNSCNPSLQSEVYPDKFNSSVI